MLTSKHPIDLKKCFDGGGVFAYPTEAIYGIGCDPDNEKAVRRLLQIKARPITKGLILIASDFSQVEKYLKPLTPSQKQYTQASATTYLFPARESTPEWLTGDFDSLAIRITKHPLARQLCKALDSALVSTSANISGETPAISIEEVITQLGSRIDGILEGKLGDSATPSKIRDSITGQIIRA